MQNFFTFCLQHIDSTELEYSWLNELAKNKKGSLFPVSYPQGFVEILGCGLIMELQDKAFDNKGNFNIGLFKQKLQNAIDRTKPDDKMRTKLIYLQKHMNFDYLNNITKSNNTVSFGVDKWYHKEKKYICTMELNPINNVDNPNEVVVNKSVIINKIKKQSSAKKIKNEIVENLAHLCEHSNVVLRTFGGSLPNNLVYAINILLDKQIEELDSNVLGVVDPSTRENMCGQLLFDIIVEYEGKSALVVSTGITHAKQIAILCKNPISTQHFISYSQNGYEAKYFDVDTYINSLFVPENVNNKTTINFVKNHRLIDQQEWNDGFSDENNYKYGNVINGFAQELFFVNKLAQEFAKVKNDEQNWPADLLKAYNSISTEFKRRKLYLWSLANTIEDKKKKMNKSKVAGVRMKLQKDLINLQDTYNECNHSDCSKELNDLYTTVFQLYNNLVGDGFTPLEKKLFHLSRARMQYVIELVAKLHSSILDNDEYHDKAILININNIKHEYYANTDLKKWCVQEAIDYMKNECKDNIEDKSEKEVSKFFLNESYVWS